MPKANLPEDPVLPPNDAPLPGQDPAPPADKPAPEPTPEPPAIAPVIQVARLRPPMLRYTGRVFDRKGRELTPEEIEALYRGKP